MLALQFILADGVTIKLGDNVWTFGLNFLIYLIVAALVGAWLLTKVIIINGIGDLNVYGVPIFRALVGAIILVAIWQLLAVGLGRGRSRNSYRRG